MPVVNIPTKILSNGHDAVAALRERAGLVSTAVRPRVAARADQAGEAVADLAGAASRTVSRVFDGRRGAAIPALAITQIPALARTASRLVRRHPGLVALGGAAVAAAAFLAWNARRTEQEAEPEEDFGPIKKRQPREPVED